MPAAPMPSGGVDLLGYDTHLPGWAAVPVFVLLWGLLTYGVWSATTRFISGIVFTPGRRMVEVALKGLHIPLVILFGLLGVNIALDSDAFPERIQEYADKVMIVVLAASLTLAVVRVVGGLIDELATRYPGFTAVHSPLHYVSRAVVIVLGVLGCLQGLGIPVSALLGAAGIAGLTVGLALQDTLRNFAAGVHLVLDRPVRPGDAVTLEDGTGGVIQSIGWRSTRLTRPDHSVLVIPNARLAEQRIVNHSPPHRWVGATLPIRLPRETDLGPAEAAIRDELARLVGDVPELLKDPAPSVSPVPGYSVHQLEVTVGFAVSEYRHQRPVSDELARRLYDRLRTEGLAFSTPRAPEGAAP